MFSETEHGRFVLSWIADACHATESIASNDPIEMAKAEGRRQVWLAIQDVLRLTEKDIRDMQEGVSYTGGYENE